MFNLVQNIEYCCVIRGHLPNPIVTQNQSIDTRLKEMENLNTKPTVNPIYEENKTT